VTEEEFWKQLEFRVCREFESMNDNALRFLWCDGFLPDDYHLADRPARITGLAWIANGRLQDRWAFELVVRAPVHDREDVAWAALLPAEDAREWLFADSDARFLRIVSSVPPNNA
jgi:hypothetical protein